MIERTWRVKFEDGLSAEHHYRELMEVIRNLKDEKNSVGRSVNHRISITCL